MNSADAYPVAQYLKVTVERIAARSVVAWDVGCQGFALGLMPRGYVLTTSPERYSTALTPRVRIPCENGAPMPHGHVLTVREREAAVRAILDVGDQLFSNRIIQAAYAAPLRHVWDP